MQHTNSNSSVKWVWPGVGLCVAIAVVVAVIVSQSSKTPEGSTPAPTQDAVTAQSNGTVDSMTAKELPSKTVANGSSPRDQKVLPSNESKAKQSPPKTFNGTVSKNGKQLATAPSVTTTAIDESEEIISREVPPISAIPTKLDHALNTIRASDAMKHVKVLTDPALGGRPAGEAGARKASDYIAGQFRDIGLVPGGQAGSYFQSFKIRIGYQIKGELTIERNGEKELMPHQDNFMPIHLPTNSADIKASCVMAGYGISSKTLDFDEYRKLDVKGKAVIVFAGVPWSADADGWVRQAEDRELGAIAYKAKNAADHGASLLLVIDNPTGWKHLLDTDEQLKLPDRDFPVDSPIPVVHLTRAAASRLTGMSEQQFRLMATAIAREQRPRSRPVDGVKVAFTASITGSARIGRNVIAMLPGSDPVKRQEAVIIGAHYDHLGERPNGIYLGANDNAAGVAAMLEAAKAFRALPQPPKRSIIFIAFAAEEIGKLGSAHYVNRPTIPIDRTVAMINFDMIARNDANHLYAVGTRSSRELHIIHQQMNQYVGMELEHPDRYRLGLSDHTAFYRKGVPIMYLFGGRHAGYHTPDDTADKLVPEKIERVSKLAFLTARAVADRPTRLTFDGYHAE